MTARPTADEDPEFWPTRQDGQPLTPFELSVYARVGLDPKQAQDWVRAAVEPYQAEGFRNAGVLGVIEAAEWIKRGVSGVQYATWINRGLDPEKALAKRDRDHARQERDAAMQDEREAHLAHRRASKRKHLQPELEKRLLITVGQIAELAQPTDQRRARAQVEPRSPSQRRSVGIDPANVTHWRKGNTDFPAPVLGGRSPQFNAHEVLEWMRDRGNLRPGQPEPDWYWWQAIRALPAESAIDQAGQMRSFVAALVALSAALRGDLPGFDAPPTHELPDSLYKARNLARAVSAHNPRLAAVLTDGIAGATPTPDAYLLVRDALEYCAAQDHPLDTWQLLDQALKVLSDLSRSAPVTEPFLADLMTGLLPDHVESVLDAACGEAELLAHLAPRASRVFGIDNDRSALCVAHARFLLLPRHGNAEFKYGDALSPGTIPDHEYDAVLIDPVFGRDRRPASWVDLALDHLRPDGRAIVVVPTSALRGKGPLAAWFAQGRIGVVVLLPPSVRFGEHRTLALCAFGGRDLAYEDVVVVDLTTRKIDSRTVAPTTSSTPRSPRAQQLDPRAIAYALRPHLDDPHAEVAELNLPLLETASRVISAADAANDGITSFAPPPGSPASTMRDAARALQDLLAQHAELPGATDLDRALTRFLNKQAPPKHP